MKSMIIKKYTKVYLFACLCMNTNKLENELNSVRVEEENELLREDFLKCMSFNIKLLGLT